MSLGHFYASAIWSSRACRKTSGMATCARWRSGVVIVTFPCLYPLHITTSIPASALRSVAKFWVAARHGAVLPLSLISEQLVEPCFCHRSQLQANPRHRHTLPPPLLRVRCLDLELEGVRVWELVMPEIAEGSRYRLLTSSSPPGEASHRCAEAPLKRFLCARCQ